MKNVYALENVPKTWKGDWERHLTPSDEKNNLLLTSEGGSALLKIEPRKLDLFCPKCPRKIDYKIKKTKLSEKSRAF